MDDRYLALLDRDQQTSIRLLQYILDKNRDVILLNNVFADLGISAYKLKRIIEMINHQMESLFDQDNCPTIILFDQGIQTSGVTSQTMKALLQRLASNSIRFKIFTRTYLYDDQDNFGDFLSRLGISRAVYYRQKTTIALTVSSLPGWDERSEAALRRSLFGVYYYFFNGATFPFSAGITAAAKQEVERIRQLEQVRLTITQRIQLQYLCAIQITRLRMKKWVEATDVEVQSTVPLLTEYVKQQFSLDDDMATLEINAINEFLVIIDALTITGATLSPELQENVTRVTQEQLNIISNAVSATLPAKMMADLTKSLRLINLKCQYPFYSLATFASPTEISFFQETYPRVHATVERLIMACQKQMVGQIDEAMLTQIYYSLMFTLLNVVPIAYFAVPINVTVDFSQGDIYSEYIKRNVLSLAPGEIQVDSVVTAKTDLYLSDIYFPESVVPQVTWENPPLPVDWEHLADVIIELKQRPVKDEADK
ncbi:hypothetical protein ACRYI5_05420 [Furfurilactobacillus sp. WILCCON 0119]|uniref:hypothetical protein n=1 Tax=Furfurilactobacillus entadae TaxID=2922307 RepID=UPI0035EF114F